MTRHFSMFRDFHLADLFTLLNGACGTAAIFFAMSHIAERSDAKTYAAGAFIVMALVFDVLDGRVARWRHTASAMGRELDSLADVISFGVAPACLAYALGFRGLWDAVGLLYFVVCGISRLARYNITAEGMSQETGKVTYFEGTPIPTSVVPLGLLMLAFHYRTLYPVHVLGLDLHLVSLLFLLSGSLMISKTLRIPKP
jgi:CDP-diacylglycerol--serine O-phosphatidyltransferase